MDAGGMPSAGVVLDGKYRLVRQLGAGGMGVVYEADHIRLRQPFAIKVLQAELAGQREFVMRFEREARAAALLRSPHVVRVFDVDVSPEGLTYMVMELLEGRDLADEAQSTTLQLPQLVDWLVQACSGLQEAHDNGIVHRDLKPANIFLSKIESGERIAKILDFGISKLDVTSTSLQTNQAAGALGTPTFMAPEQIRNRRVDGRADLWALGVILYRLLGSRWPFNGKGDQGYMAAVVADPALPFEMVRPDLPYELASVIMKALEKDVASRYRSANDMAAALAPFGSGRGPLTSMNSLPPAGPSGPTAIPAQSFSPAIASRAVIVADAASTQRDRAGVLDTVPDVTHPPPRAARVVTDYLPPYAAASPLATVLDAPPATPAHANARARRNGVGVVVAACLAAGIGFGAYTLMTTRRPSASPVSAGADLPFTSAAPSGAAELPPPSIELPPAKPVPEARVAPTGVPPEPSASAPPRRRGLRPAASTTPAASVSVPAAESIPDHL